MNEQNHAEGASVTPSSSVALLQTYFDLTGQYRKISAQLDALRPQVVKLLKEQETQTVQGGVINLKWRKANPSYSPNLFDALSIDQIKLCAKFSSPLIKKQGLSEIASLYLINRPDIPHILCKPLDTAQ